jgi:hypothetical protein
VVLGFLVLFGSLVGFAWIATAVVDGLSGAGWSPSGGDLLPSAGHAAALRMVLALLLWFLVVGAVALAGILAWKRWGPAALGHASRVEVNKELSLAAAQDKATVTRPVYTRAGTKAEMTTAELRGLAAEEVGAPCHKSQRGPWLVSTFENPTGAIAPTQSGKSRTDLAHKVIAAPGALLCSTSKPDLFEFAALSRARRRNAGPVVVIDATGTVSWPAQPGWSFLSGCRDPKVALRRAQTMVDAAAVALASQNTGNDAVFRERAGKVLRMYFVAMVAGRASVTDLLSWALSDPLLTDPAEHLRLAGYPELADNLLSELALVPETRDAVWMSVRRVLEPLLNPEVRALTCPPGAAGLDLEDIIARKGSVFLIAGEEEHAEAIPLLTALTEQWISTARSMALECPKNRLDPPATAVLDELTNATPIPKLPKFISDTAGRGVPIHWAAQSIPALDECFGEKRARMLLNNTTVTSIWGGLNDDRSLKELSTRTGHHEKVKHQQHHDGALGTGRSSISTESRPTYREGDIRGIPRDRVLVLGRHLDPILAKPVDVSQRADWPQIAADIDTLRAGDGALDRLVTVDGYLHQPGEPVTATAVRIDHPDHDDTHSDTDESW